MTIVKAQKSEGRAGKREEAGAAFFRSEEVHAISKECECGQRKKTERAKSCILYISNNNNNKARILKECYLDIAEKLHLSGISSLFKISPTCCFLYHQLSVYCFLLSKAESSFVYFVDT